MLKVAIGLAAVSASALLLANPPETAATPSEPTLEQVGVLALIVLIRTFLSFSLEVELEGKLPWQRTGAGQATAK